MKYDDRMVFAHPVLRESSDDYSDSSFKVEFGEAKESSDEVEFEVSIDLENPELTQLLAENKARCGIIITCLDTIENRLENVTIGSKKIVKLPARSFFGRIVIRPLIYTISEVKKWKTADMHKEFGNNVPLDSATLVAVGVESRFSLDRKRLKPFESIFEMEEDAETPVNEFTVNLDLPKITIYVNPATKNALDQIRYDERGLCVLLNSLYLPVVIAILAELKTGAEHLASNSWHRTFTAKCDALDINLATCEPLVDAQKLLNSPLERIITKKEEIFQ